MGDFGRAGFFKKARVPLKNPELEDGVWEVWPGLIFSLFFYAPKSACSYVPKVD
jgi:hypothetical protein